MKSLYHNRKGLYPNEKCLYPNGKCLHPNMESLVKTLISNEKVYTQMKNVYTLIEMSTPEYGKFNQKSIFQWKSLYPNGKGLSLTWQSWSQ